MKAKQNVSEETAAEVLTGTFPGNSSAMQKKNNNIKDNMRNESK